MVILDIFSHCGGFILAAEKLGFHVLGMHETNKFSKKVLAKNFPERKIFTDLSCIDEKLPLDILTSTLVYNRHAKKTNWKEIFKTVKRIRPRWFVTNGTFKKFSVEIDAMCTNLENNAYETLPLVLPACASGAPQRQDRLWLIAIDSSLRFKECNSKYRSYYQEHEKWEINSSIAEWEAIKPETWRLYRVQDWLEFNSRTCRANPGLPNRMDRIRSLMNSPIPQMAYAILSMIMKVEHRAVETMCEVIVKRAEKKLGRWR